MADKSKVVIVKWHENPIPREDTFDTVAEAIAWLKGKHSSADYPLGITIDGFVGKDDHRGYHRKSE